MKSSLRDRVLTTITCILGIPLLFTPSAALAQETSFPEWTVQQFACYRSPTSLGDIPTTYAEQFDPETSKTRYRPLIRWRSDVFPNYPPERRCAEVSQRFQNFYQSDNLRYLTTGTVNNYPVICVVPFRDDTCGGDQILLTLGRNDNAKEVLQELLDPNLGQGNILVRGTETFLNFNDMLEGDYEEQPGERVEFDTSSNSPIDPEPTIDSANP
jgi:hypothetical protein